MRLQKTLQKTIVVDDRTDRIDLQAQIAQLPIKNPLSLDKFLNPKDEAILDKEGDIFDAIIAAYSSCQGDKEEESSDDKEEIKQVEDDKALRAIETVKLQKLQKGTDLDIKALDRIEREIVRYKSDQTHQTTILRFFRPN